MSHLRCDVTALLTLVIQRLQAILLQYSSLRWLRHITEHYYWYDTDGFSYYDQLSERCAWVLFTGL